MKPRCGAPVQSESARRYGKGQTGACRRPVRSLGERCYQHKGEK